MLPVIRCQFEGAFLEADLLDPIYIRFSKEVHDELRKLQPDMPRDCSTIIVKLKRSCMD